MATVSVSVTLVYCARRLSWSSRDLHQLVAQPFYFSQTKYEPNSSRGFPSLRASNWERVGKSRKIRPINRSHSPKGSSCVARRSYHQPAQASGGLSAIAEPLVLHSKRDTRRLEWLTHTAHRLVLSRLDDILGELAFHCQSLTYSVWNLKNVQKCSLGLCNKMLFLFDFCRRWRH